ncbi:hypothetical protein ACM67B_09980 [Neisseria sp. CCUG17229]|uniref:hypothetical protein n=1 Tax=Neisseria sp. CCUG17229 TaxID=3392036 RepID=UPI003A1032D9
MQQMEDIVDIQEPQFSESDRFLILAEQADNLLPDVLAQLQVCSNLSMHNLNSRLESASYWLMSQDQPELILAGCVLAKELGKVTGKRGVTRFAEYLATQVKDYKVEGIPLPADEQDYILTYSKVFLRLLNGDSLAGCTLGELGYSASKKSRLCSKLKIETEDANLYFNWSFAVGTDLNRYAGRNLVSKYLTPAGAQGLYEKWLSDNNSYKKIQEKHPNRLGWLFFQAFECAAFNHRRRCFLNICEINSQ